MPCNLISPESLLFYGKRWCFQREDFRLHEQLPHSSVYDFSVLSTRIQDDNGAFTVVVAVLEVSSGIFQLQMLTQTSS